MSRYKAFEVPATQLQKTVSFDMAKVKMSIQDDLNTHTFGESLCI